MSLQNSWQYHNHAIFPAVGAHEIPDLSMIDDGSVWKVGGGTPLLVRWTTDFDCGYETKFWACILDKPFRVQELKAKRRYEITKGTRNFYCRLLMESDLDAMYAVYLESLQGYQGHITPISSESFKTQWEHALHDKTAILMGVWERKSALLCGWAHCLKHGKYIPISSLKTRVSKERDGVNFALVNGICEYYEKDLENGCYLCDGYRNLIHQTEFQNWLEKYFQFRKAYCVLHIKYRGLADEAVKMVFPLRHLLKKWNGKGFFSTVNAVLTMEEWKRQCEAAKKAQNMIGEHMGHD